jgi:hypothetical protein
VNSLISCTVQRIKAALHCEDAWWYHPPMDG